MTIGALAEAAGLAESTVAGVERGQRSASYATMRKISAALGIEASEITEFAAVIARRAAFANPPGRDDTSTCSNG